MEIKVMRNSVYCKQPCLACGVRDYPGDVAFFTESGEWLCDWCVETGEEHIRQALLERAERYRRVADSHEAASREDIGLPDEIEVEAMRGQLDIKRFTELANEFGMWEEDEA
jgi:hypothetical protein